MRKIFSFLTAILFAGSMMATDYQLVASAADLEAGAHYVIGASYNKKFYVMSTVSNANNRKMVEATMADGVVTGADDIMTFTLGGSADAWTFATDNYAGTAGYLNATSTTGSNNLKVVAALDNYAYFTITIADGVTTVTCNGKESRNILYLNGTTCFSCYNAQTTSQYVKPSLYKEVTAPAPSNVKTVYCKCEQSWWTVDNAAVAVHYWGGATSTTWPGVRMDSVKGEAGLWKYDVPTDITGIMFVRVNGSGDVADWGAKTANLTLPTDDKNLYTITSTAAVWGDPGVTGEWSVYGEVTPIDPPTPEKKLPKVGLGANFNGWNWEANLLTPATDSLSASLKVTLGVTDTIQFKIVSDGSWLSLNGEGETLYGLHREWPKAEHVNLINSGRNFQLTTDVEGEYTFTWTYADSTIAITFPEKPVTPPTPEEKLPKVGLGANFNGWNWEANLLTPATDSLSASLKVTLGVTDTIQFKIVSDGSWLSLNGEGETLYGLHREWPKAEHVNLINSGRNFQLTTDVEGEYTFTWTYADSTIAITFPAKPVEPVENGMWKVTSETAVAANTVYVDNNLLTLSSVFAGTLKENARTIAGEEFTHAIQVRVDAWPTESVKTGTEKSGSTPLVLVANEDIEITLYYNRQAIDASGAENDNKDVWVFDHTAITTPMTGVFTIDQVLEGNSYLNATKKLALTKGHTYTIAAKGTTLQLHGIKYGVPAPAPVVPAKYYITGDSALMADAANDATLAWNPAAIKAEADTMELSLKAEQAYKLKVTVDGQWTTAKGFNDLTQEDKAGLSADNDGNICFSLTEAGKVTVVYKEGVFAVTGKFYVEPQVVKYCEKATGHLGDANFGDANGRILLTLQKIANSNNVLVKVKNNNAAGNTKTGLNYLWVNAANSKGVVRYGNGTHTEADVEEVSVVVEFETAQENYNFINIHWAYSGWEGEWALDGLAVTAAELCDAEEPQPVEHTYTVAGSSAVAFGTAWDPTVAANDMVKQEDGTYKWEKTELTLPAGAIEFKVCEDHAWTVAYPAQNYSLAIAEAGVYTITITFNPATEENKVAAVATKTGSAVVDPTVSVKGSWDGWANELNFVLADNKETATLTVENIKAGTYEFKVILNGSDWRSNGYEYNRNFTGAEGITGNDSNNMKLVADAEGTYTFTWTFATNALNITFPAKPVEPKYPIIETYFATTDGWALDADSKAVYDAAGEKITVTIAADKVAQWQGQVKIKGPVAEAGKCYHFAMKMKANKAVNGITVKWQDNNNEPNLIYLDKAVNLVANTEWAMDTTVAGIAGNGILVLDFGFAKAGDIIEIYDLVIEETACPEPEPTNYYLVGTMTEWAVVAEPQYLFAANTEAEGEYILATTLTVGQGIKVVGVQGTTQTWYPDGMGTEYVVDADHAGNVTIYFRPAGNTDWAAFGGYIYIQAAGTGIDNTADGIQAVKVLRDGQILIIKGDKTFNIQGQIVK